MKWNDILKFDSEDDWTPESDKAYKQRMKERDEKSMREGGGVDRSNPLHVVVEEILSKNHSYDEFDEIADRIKLRVSWLRKHAEYGGKD